MVCPQNETAVLTVPEVLTKPRVLKSITAVVFSEDSRPALSENTLFGVVVRYFKQLARAGIIERRNTIIHHANALHGMPLYIRGISE